MLSLNPFRSQSSADHHELGFARSLVEQYERRLKYENKRDHYSNILWRTETQLRRYDVLELHNCIVLSKYYGTQSSSFYTQLQQLQSLTEKKALLEQQLSLLENLIHSYDERTEILFNRNDELLRIYFDDYDYLLEFRKSRYAYTRIYEIDTKLRYLRFRVESLLKKIYGRIHRDIRQMIRSIKRFLLHAMNDEDDIDDDVVPVLLTSLINHSIHSYGKKGNNQRAEEAKQRQGFKF